MGKNWSCPAHDGELADYTIVDKDTGRGRWWVKVRCTTCRALLMISKSGIRVLERAQQAA